LCAVEPGSGSHPFLHALHCVRGKRAERGTHSSTLHSPPPFADNNPKMATVLADPLAHKPPVGPPPATAPAATKPAPGPPGTTGTLPPPVKHRAKGAAQAVATVYAEVGSRVCSFWIDTPTHPLCSPALPACSASPLLHPPARDSIASHAPSLTTGVPHHPSPHPGRCHAPAQPPGGRP
jgi:hypothetical protein